MNTRRYIKLPFMQRQVGNRMSVLFQPSLVLKLSVRGRRSGEWRTTPVNLLVVDGQRYLVAPRGQTQWVRNIRVAGGGGLRLGRSVEPFRAVEMPDRDKPVILRRYLKRWKFEVGVFFDGVDAKSPDARLLEIAPGYPVFRVEAGSTSS